MKFYLKREIQLL